MSYLQTQYAMLLRESGVRACHTMTWNLQTQRSYRRFVCASSRLLFLLSTFFSRPRAGVREAETFELHKSAILALPVWPLAHIEQGIFLATILLYYLVHICESESGSEGMARQQTGGPPWRQRHACLWNRRGRGEGKF